MDATTERLVDYALSVRYEDLSPDTVRASKQRLLDTLGCIAAAYDHPVSVAARALASQYRNDSAAATVLGGRSRTAAELAAFANGVMLRVLDLSDMYRVKSGGHPSDVIAALLAASELGARDGRALLTATAVAYEVYCGCCDAIDLNAKGWDQPVYGILASVLGASRLMHLTRDEAAQALALALVPNMALYQTRQGELSAWKGCAGANASRNALFAVALARAGFSGPEAPFEGRHGLWDIVGRFDWPLRIGEPPHRVERTHLKCFPICYHGQSAVWAALALRNRVTLARVKGIRIDTYRKAVDLMASDPSRWAPANAETADHSLPYVVALALSQGRVGLDAFTRDRLQDANLRALMKRTSVFEDEALTAQYPESAPCSVTLELDDGSIVREDVRYPKGHEKAPLSDEEVKAKFKELFTHMGSRRQAARVVDLVENLESMEDVAQLFRAFQRRLPRKPSAATSPHPEAVDSRERALV